MNQVVLRAAESARAYCEARGAHMELEIEQGLPPVKINAAEIELLLMNLIHNSAESGADIEITIRTEQTAEAVRLAVHDNGPGIGDDARQHAFEPFFSTRYDDGGTGLGLSIAHGIVADHGGSIHIDGQGGKGTTVTVELPFADRE